VFGCEAHFYNDTTVEAGALERPEAIYVGYVKPSSWAAATYCIIMGSADGATSYKRVVGIDSAPHMKLVMRALARFHARWWNHKQEGILSCYSNPNWAGGPLPKFPRIVPHSMLAKVFQNGIKAITHCYSEDAKYAGVPKFAQEYGPFVAAARVPLRRRRHAVVRKLWKAPYTLVHGDAHTENIFFGAQFPGGCTFIDFGLLMFGPALGDVATVIAGGMNVDSRRQHEEMLVKLYYEALTQEFGVKGYSWDECWDDYQFLIIKPFFQMLTMAPSLAKQRVRRQGVFAAELSEGSKKLAAMYVQLNTRISTALADHKWVEKVAAMAPTSNAFFRPLG